MKALIKAGKKKGNKQHAELQLCVQVLSTDILLSKMPGTRGGVSGRQAHAIFS